MRDLAVVVVVLLTAASVAADTSGVFAPQNPVDVHYWTDTNSPRFVYPELSNGDWGMPALQQKPNFGIAVSGGGYRATTLALGWIRALYFMGYLQKARYLSSNSGGSWFNGAFSYTQVPAVQFLGPYIAPANLTLGAANALDRGSYGFAISSGTIIKEAIDNMAVQALTPNTKRVRLWSDAVGQAFLEPFGVGAHASTVTALGTKGRVAERVANAYPGLTALTATATPDRPYPIILGSLFRSEHNQTFYPIEFTPLYTGVPPSYPAYQPPLGGSLVEPLGLNAVPLTQPGASSPAGQKTVPVGPEFSVPLVTMVGISSSFVAQGATPTSQLGMSLTGTEQLTYWTPPSTNATKQTFADGGGIDNLAVTPLLRRRVAHVFVGVATIQGPTTNASDFAVAQYDIAALFGAVPTDEPRLRRGINGVPVPEWNRNGQVFETKGWQQLYDAMAALVAAGKPAVYRTTYTVLNNTRQAITGGWKVDVLWVWNTECASWEDALPSDTRATLDKPDNNRQDRRALETFPYVSTFDANYSPLLVSLLSQQASWVAFSAQAQLKDMVGGSSGR